MRKSSMVIIALVFSMILVTLIMNSIPVFAFNKNGPAPIPGNLFPHPGTLIQHALKYNSALTLTSYKIAITNVK